MVLFEPRGLWLSSIVQGGIGWRRSVYCCVQRYLCEGKKGLAANRKCPSPDVPSPHAMLHFPVSIGLGPCGTEDCRARRTGLGLEADGK
jgi:hypothetical protein